MSAIERVLLASQRSSPSDRWVDSHKVIEKERRDIVDMLESQPDLRVYGFNTLLGHLDTVDSVESHQEVLLQGHLVGRVAAIDGLLPDLLLSTKLEQLSHGGSGIHPETYALLLDNYGASEAMVGAWNASYGSGDVVPGAWWVKNVRDHNPAMQLRSGDLIALISGTFVSTAFALNSSVLLIRYLARFMAEAVELVQAGRVNTAENSRDWVAELVYSDLLKDSAIRHQGNLQASVSMRDLGSYTAPIGTTIDATGQAIEQRLATFSGNPTFAYTDGAIRHLSQASFLDLNLTLALTSSLQLIHFCMGAVQRFIQHLCDSRKSDAPLDYVKFIQPPKVASAKLSEAELRHGGLPTRLSYSESEGIEDQADFSLVTAQSLADLLTLAFDQMAILEDVSTAMGREIPHERSAHYANNFLAHFADSTDATLSSYVSNTISSRSS